MSWPQLIWGRAKHTPEHFWAKGTALLISPEGPGTGNTSSPLLAGPFLHCHQQIGFQLDFGLRYNSPPSDAAHYIASLTTPYRWPIQGRIFTFLQRAKYESCETWEASWFRKGSATRTLIEKKVYHEFGNYSIRGEDWMVSALQRVSGQVSRGTN